MEKHHVLKETLDLACWHHEQLAIAELDTAIVEAEILELRRQIRDSRQPQGHEVFEDNRYRLCECIGRGGFATVWKAYDRQEHRLVAIKILHRRFEDRTQRERFFRGARKMATLQHPGIVQVLARRIAAEPHDAFVMEYVEGGDLRRTVLDRGVSVEQVLQIVRQVGAALHFAHQQGVVHRDVKPANILLDQEGIAKLTDFDLVLTPDETGGTRTENMFGTFLYTAPEVLRNPQDAEGTSDVFSLGMTAVFALYGRELPLVVLRDPRSFLECLPGSAALQEILLKAISWDAKDRFQSMAAFCQALDDQESLSLTSREGTQRLQNSHDLHSGRLRSAPCRKRENTGRKVCRYTQQMHQGIQSQQQRHPTRQSIPKTQRRVRETRQRLFTQVMALALVGLVLLVGIVGGSWGQARGAVLNHYFSELGYILEEDYIPELERSLDRRLDLIEQIRIQTEEAS
jgi:serine/threonine protein kinase